MYKTRVHTFSVYQFNQLRHYSQNIHHLITTRKGGVSAPPYDTLNVSFNTNDLKSNIQQNRNKIARGIGVNRILFPEQVHGDTVKIIKTGNENLQATDGLLTNMPGTAIGVLIADCVPVLLYDPVKLAIGVVHAGWKGTISKIVQKTITNKHFLYKKMKI